MTIAEACELIARARAREQSGDPEHWQTHTDEHDAGLIKILAALNVLQITDWPPLSG